MNKAQRAQRTAELQERAAYWGGCLYLNNSGHRWIVPGATVRVIGKDYDKVRSVEYFEALGNFAVAVLKYKGTRRRFFIEDKDENGNPIVRFED